MFWQQGEDRRTATLPLCCHSTSISAWSPLPCPSSSRCCRAEGKNLLQARSMNYVQFLSYLTLVNRNVGGEEKQSLFFLFYLVNN